MWISGGAVKKNPFHISTIEKTFYSFFIHQDPLETPIDHLLEEGDNPRSLERNSNYRTDEYNPQKKYFLKSLIPILALLKLKTAFKKGSVTLKIT